MDGGCGTSKRETVERKIYTNIRFPLILANMRLKNVIRRPVLGMCHTVIQNVLF